jgi:hypothetical protein
MFFCSCTSSTLIESEPKGAMLYIDNQLVGETPYVMADQKFATTCTKIRLEKKGFETIETNICRDEQVDIGAVVAGIFFYLPWLWITGYNPVHMYILKPVEINDYYFEEDNKIDESANENTNQVPITSISENKPVSKVQKLKDLKQLLDEGILSQEEYNLEKKKILEQEEW